jgi:amidase
MCCTFVRPLRIGCWSSAWDGIEVAPECLEAMRSAAALLQAAGHEVMDTILPEIDYANFVEAHLQVLAANVAIAVNSVAKDHPHWQNELEPAILDGYRLELKLSAEPYVRAINTFHSVGRRLERHMVGFDLILTPTLTRPRRGWANSARRMISAHSAGRRRATRLFRLLSTPRGSPPRAYRCWTAAGLPIGIQLIGHSVGMRTC